MRNALVPGRLSLGLQLAAVASGVFVCLSPALCAEDSTTLQPPPNVPYFHSGETGTAIWSSDPAQPSTATGGVDARYDGILLRCDQLMLRYAPLTGTTANVPSEGFLKPGPAGPADNRVVLDTREATAPNVGFRGLFTPASVTMQRLVDATLPPLHVRYHVDLPDAGSFQGLLHMAAGWAPYRGWADHIELLIGAEVIGGNLSNMRVLKIILNGRPATDAVPARNAEINRLKPGQTLPPPEQALTVEHISGHNDAPTIFIEFDEQGRPGTRWVGRNNLWGDPALFNLNAGGKTPTPTSKPNP